MFCILSGTCLCSWNLLNRYLSDKQRCLSSIITTRGWSKSYRGAIKKKKRNMPHRQREKIWIYRELSKRVFLQPAVLCDWQHQSHQERSSLVQSLQGDRIRRIMCWVGWHECNPMPWCVIGNWLGKLWCLSVCSVFWSQLIPPFHSYKICELLSFTPGGCKASCQSPGTQIFSWLVLKGGNGW